MRSAHSADLRQQIWQCFQGNAPSLSAKHNLRNAMEECERGIYAIKSKATLSYKVELSSSFELPLPLLARHVRRVDGNAQSYSMHQRPPVPY